jgi:CMP-N-acetylneuraminic acid synthetase
MSDPISFFLPTRKGSARVKEKNTRPFSDLKGGILELKLKQLLKSQRISEIVLSTNDERSMDIAKTLDSSGTRIKVIERPEHLCLDTTPLQDLIAYVPQIVKTPHILWGHATTPFCTEVEYDKAIQAYFENRNRDYDSLISVTPLRNFLLRPEDGSIFNYDHSEGKWPRTQDLPLLYEVNHAMFITTRQVYLQNKDRIGNKRYLLEQDKITSFDIDWEDDFNIAEAIYEKLYRR